MGIRAVIFNGFYTVLYLVIILFYHIKNKVMNCERPVKNEKTNKWEVWDFAYEEKGERHYELHEFFTHKEAVEFWKIRNPKQNNN